MRKTKQQFIEELSDCFDYDVKSLQKMSLNELKELYEE